MPAQKKSYGSPRGHTGKLQSADGTHVPIRYLARLKTREPIPVTVTTSVFTLNGDANRIIPLWIGNDYYELATTKTFTSATSFSSIDTNGAVATATSMAAGIWYMYAGITGTTDTAYAFQLLPSTLPPEPTSDEYNLGWYVHPGASKTAHWIYVGFIDVATAGDADTAAAFTAMTKRGYWYERAEATSSQTGQSSAAATADFSASVPVHGCEVGGYLQNAGASSFFIVSPVTLTDSTAAGIIECSNDDTGAVTMPFSGLIPDTAGALYSIQGNSAACTIGITRIKDVV